MDVLEIFLEIFGDIALEFVLEVLGELAITEMQLFADASISGSQRIGRMVASGLGFLATGGLVGYWSSLLLPHRVLPKLTVSGASMVLAPLCAGLAMQLFGRWRRRQGSNPTYLATFWGGGLFAFAMALARWWMAGR
jgi:hypothetical protein